MADELSRQLIILEKLLKLPENRECADCRRKSPTWASILFGTFICIKCSGFHRELSTSIAKVKSINLDKWNKSVVELYTKINNRIANEYWESKLDCDESLFKRIREDEDKLRDFIFDKYQRKKWCKKGRCPMTKLYAGEDISQ